MLRSSSAPVTEQEHLYDVKLVQYYRMEIILTGIIFLPSPYDGRKPRAQTMAKMRVPPCFSLCLEIEGDESVKSFGFTGTYEYN